MSMEAQLMQGAKLLPKNFGGGLFPYPTYGNIFYVNSVTGSNTANNGASPSQPLATLAAAHSLATASNGDIIVLMPGHVETVSAAAGIAISKAGLTIIGVGFGSQRPTFTSATATAASIDISGANCYITNIVYTCGIDAQTAMMNITSADVTLDNVEFNTNSGTVGAVLGILTAATAARLKVINSRFLGPATNSGTTTTAQIKHEVGVDYVIQNCYFTGKLTQAILNATALLRGLIDNNRFVIATGTLAISVNASSTPFITNNRINVPSGTTPITAAAGFVAGNTYSAAAGVTAGTAVTM